MRVVENHKLQVKPCPHLAIAYMNMKKKEQIEKVNDKNFKEYAGKNGGGNIDKSTTYYESYIEYKMNEIIDRLNQE